MKQRVIRILTALDIFAFALVTFGDAHRNETVSGALWSMDQDHKLLGRVLRPFVDWLFLPFERDHCYVSWLAEVSTYRK